MIFSFPPQLALNASLPAKLVQISVGTQTEVIDFEMLPPTIKKKPQTPAELEQALALEQSRVAALKEELAAVRILFFFFFSSVKFFLSLFSFVDLDFM